jgi:hypothetical protein
MEYLATVLAGGLRSAGEIGGINAYWRVPTLAITLLMPLVVGEINNKINVFWLLSRHHPPRLPGGNRLDGTRTIQCLHADSINPAGFSLSAFQARCGSEGPP